MTILRCPIKPEEDGVTHINVYSKGATELGRNLSNFAHTPFVHNRKWYASVEGWWYWYVTGQQHDYLRELYGFAAKQEGRKYSQVTTVTPEILKQVYYDKIIDNINLGVQFISAKLPFTHYYNYGGKIIIKHQWTGELWNIVRDDILNNE